VTRPAGLASLQPPTLAARRTGRSGTSLVGRPSLRPCRHPPPLIPLPQGGRGRLRRGTGHVPAPLNLSCHGLVGEGSLPGRKPRKGGQRNSRHAKEVPRSGPIGGPIRAVRGRSRPRLTGLESQRWSTTNDGKDAVHLEFTGVEGAHRREPISPKKVLPIQLGPSLGPSEVWRLRNAFWSRLARALRLRKVGRPGG
jgi:hypothetical protein